MTTLAIALGFIAVFALGIGVGAAVARSHYRSRAYFQRAVENARLQGRLERGDDQPGLEPPEPWRS